MALSIAKPKHRSLTNPSLVHLFSSSSSPYQDAPNSPSQSPSEDHHHQQTSQSSYFTQLKATMKPQPNNSSSPRLTTPVNLNPSISKSAGELASLENIRKKLSEFRSFAQPPVNSNASGPPYSGQQNQQSTTSFQELYKRQANVKPEDRTVSSQSSPNRPAFDYAAIQESIKQLTPKNVPLQTGRRSVDRSDLAKGQLKSTVIGGTQELPLPMLAKEQMSGNHDMGIEFVKIYSTEELGEKLRSLRPEMKEKGWFSFEELAERLRKLRTVEVEEIENSNLPIPIRQLRESLYHIREENLKKKKAEARMEILVKLGDLDCMAYPPKEHLVEQYFHPDNMSSAEKLKLELSNVREEFKMSESDCGSARVQVAQLTTKIKHLSSVLHKKDKHSRKGLQEMVQRRKKLLKYLRRTDWDSYCFVLSKLGLRDNADMKL